MTSLLRPVSCFSLPATPQLLSCTVTQLLDRTAALEAEKVSRESSTQDSKPRDPAAPAASTEGTAQIRSDLAETLRSNGQLQSRIKIAEAELVKLRAKGKSDGKLIDELSRERASFAQKVKDRDEELKGKAKLLDVGLPIGPYFGSSLTCTRMSTMKLYHST